MKKIVCSISFFILISYYIFFTHKLTLVLSMDVDCVPCTAIHQFHVYTMYRRFKVN